MFCESCGTGPTCAVCGRDDDAERRDAILAYADQVAHDLATALTAAGFRCAVVSPRMRVETGLPA